ncbi:MAG: glycoside hydrolase family 3 C-terminal domain-containing protein [Sphingomonas sp.]
MAKSLVLLKNQGVLPVKASATVLVAGPAADSLGIQTGGWTLSWQGDGNGNELFPGGTTIYAGIAAAVRAGGGTATLSPDGSFASKPDVAIVVFGEQPMPRCAATSARSSSSPATSRRWRCSGN